MDDGKLSVAVSDHRREFIDEELAAGTYASEAEIVDAALELLERTRKMGAFRTTIAKDDDDLRLGEMAAFDTAEELSQHIANNAESLRRELSNAQASGLSGRQIPDIMNAVKTKLRANGTL